MQVIELSERYKSFLLVILLFLSFFGKAIFAQEYPDKNVHNLLIQGIDHIIKQEYSEAQIIFAKLDKNYPDLPLGNIYFSALKIAKSVDYGEPFLEQEIEDHFLKAEQQCKILLKKKNNDLWNNYFYALLKGYTAYFRALKRNYISAFSNGLSALNHYEKCLDIDSSFFESYIALGTYKYWKSEKTGWIPFVSEEQELGIKYLEKSLNHPSYNYHLGVNSLIWIYLNEDRDNDAIRLSERALKAYPQSRLFKMGLAAAVQRKNNLKALTLYKEVLNSVKQLNIKTRYNEITLKHKIAMIYNELGDKKQALEYCDDILRISGLSEFETDKLEKRLERVKKLKKELSDT